MRMGFWINFVNPDSSNNTARESNDTELQQQRYRAWKSNNAEPGKATIQGQRKSDDTWPGKQRYGARRKATIRGAEKATIRGHASNNTESEEEQQYKARKGNDTRPGKQHYGAKKATTPGQRKSDNTGPGKATILGRDGAKETRKATIRG